MATTSLPVSGLGGADEGVTPAMDHRGHTPPLSIAPMMDRTDRHYRVFMRTLTRHTLLYTEMLTARAVLHGDRPTLLGFDEIEHPISLQLGGDDPERMAEASSTPSSTDDRSLQWEIVCLKTISHAVTVLPADVEALDHSMPSTTFLPVWTGPGGLCVGHPW